jgi:hypothetical protein
VRGRGGQQKEMKSVRILPVDSRLALLQAPGAFIHKTSWDYSCAKGCLNMTEIVMFLDHSVRVSPPPPPPILILTVRCFANAQTGCLIHSCTCLISTTALRTFSLFVSKFVFQF